MLAWNLHRSDSRRRSTRRATPGRPGRTPPAGLPDDADPGAGHGSGACGSHVRCSLLGGTDLEASQRLVRIFRRAAGTASGRSGRFSRSTPLSSVRAPRRCSLRRRPGHGSARPEIRHPFPLFSPGLSIPVTAGDTWQAAVKSRRTSRFRPASKTWSSTERTPSKIYAVRRRRLHRACSRRSDHGRTWTRLRALEPVRMGAITLVQDPAAARLVRRGHRSRNRPLAGRWPDLDRRQTTGLPIGAQCRRYRRRSGGPGDRLSRARRCRRLQDERRRAELGGQERAGSSSSTGGSRRQGPGPPAGAQRDFRGRRHRRPDRRAGPVRPGSSGGSRPTAGRRGRAWTTRKGAHSMTPGWRPIR